MATHNRFHRFIQVVWENEQFWSMNELETNTLLTIEEALHQAKFHIPNLNAYIDDVKKRLLDDNQYKLTSNELIALLLYIREVGEEDLHVPLNKALRSKDKEACNSWLPFLQLLYSAFKKLPAFEGCCWRAGTSEIRDQIQEGQCITWINAIYAKYIDNYSTDPNTQEILLMPGTRLQVEKIELHEKDKGITQVYLQEKSMTGKEAPMPILISSERQYEQMTSGSSSSNSSHNAAFIRSTSKNYETKHSTIPKSDDHSNMAQASSSLEPAEPPHPSCKFTTDENKTWLECQFKNHECTMIFMPNECDTYLKNPPGSIDGDMLNRIKGSMFGLLLGDALGAHVEFRPHGYLLANPVSDLQSGGTWGLEKGQ
ncbi:unnamed protein product, partial [Rotaria sordida]